MKRLTAITAAIASLLTLQAYADLEFLRLDSERQAQVQKELHSTPCTCGCGMSVGQCLVEDQSCPVSPELARSIIARISGDGTTDQPQSFSPAGGLIGTNNSAWYNQLSGKLLVYMKTTSVSRIKECTWLYSDGTFSTNTDSGNFSGGGSVIVSGAGQSGSHGRWSTNDNVVMFHYNGGNRDQYSMVNGDDGFLYLNGSRHFVVEHDDPTCQ